jgi:putative IMPACT (imprinted ancient) family translation regulator
MLQDKSCECTQLIEKKLSLQQVLTQVKRYKKWTSTEEEGSFARYSNSYMYNCEEFDYTLLRHLSRLNHVILH